MKVSKKSLTNDEKGIVEWFDSRELNKSCKILKILRYLKGLLRIIKRTNALNIKYLAVYD